jgi:hypothetical protein
MGGVCFSVKGLEAVSADYQPVGSQWQEAQGAEDIGACPAELPAEAWRLYTG